ncbi:unnamed protein product [Blepharisma stoltei]|uniref:Uncharacterized protein n=1 Tax=Blepharisma stoltei TaxID=1481888 RepID=A0AAU9K6V1_9CILI|nr:unnamed protein product [Blepharisma stoltei]
MGCEKSRPRSSEEIIISAAEEGLGFQDINVHLIDSTFRKFSHMGRINQTQLKRISRQLRINIVDFGPHVKINEMFYNLRKEEGEYFLRDLLVIGIMLGKGSNADKASLLFQVFDETSEGVIEISRLKDQVFKTIFQHCVNSLGNLVTTQQCSESLELKNKKYLDELKQVEADGIKKICDGIIADKTSRVIDEAEFVRVMCEFEMGNLLSSFGFRTFFKEVFNTSPPKKVWSNPFGKKK